MLSKYEDVQRSADYIKSKISGSIPEVAIVLGSGLDSVVNNMNLDFSINYSEIPGFFTTNIDGHKGIFSIRSVMKSKAIFMQGRIHYYEGYSMQDIVFYIYVLKLLGVKYLVLTNAAGALNINMKPGDFMFINDYINISGVNPLIGYNDERFGSRFPDMTEPYSENLRNKAKEVMIKNRSNYMEGTYLYMAGPCYETKTEAQYYKQIGSDVIGMSTVPETIVANYVGMEVLGISCITNMATGVQSNLLNHDEILMTANYAADNLKKFLEEFIGKI